MNRREGFTLIELMVVIVIIGVLATMAIANYVRMKAHASEAQVKSDVHTVQLAVEDYGVTHGGRYSAAGAELQPFLPGGRLLSNAFTRNLSEPQFGAPAATSGQIGVQVVQINGLPNAYTITGFGKDELIQTVRGGQ